ncbi:MAG: hypothetical protein F6J86_42890 [Symploca sp. SIO1B1]|nr:hypothetical protein [Symploca sp. SIO1B1]
MQKSWSRITRGLLGLIVLGTVNPGLLACGVSPHSILQVEPKGKVKVKRGRDSWNAYSGLGLENNHRLVLPSGAKVTIYCSNAQIREVSSRGEHQVSSICSSAGSNHNNRCTISRNDEDPNTPYLISPRNTTIAESQPLLSWHPVEGATSYRVEISRVKWSTEVEETGVRYNGEKALQPGKRYTVKITAYEGEKDIAVSSARFSILSEEEYQQLELAAKELEEKFSQRQVLAFPLAKLYRKYKLYADAIDVLQWLTSEETQGAEAYQLLGQTYWDVGLLGLAKEQFSKALEVVEGEDNLGLKGSLQASLGIVTDRLATTQTDYQEATRLLEKALVAYRSLEELTTDEKARVAEIEERLVEVKGKIE